MGSSHQELHNYQHNQFQNIFITPEGNPFLLAVTPCPGFLQPLPSSPRRPLIYFLSPQIALFWACHVNGIIQYVAFCVWLLSLRIVFKTDPHCSMDQYFIPFFKKEIYLFIFREGKGGRKRGRETSIDCLFFTPKWGAGPQPRHVP